MSTASVEKQIDSYLARLNTTQKKAVLTVVKTIALAQEDYANIWDDKNFVKEMDERSAAYENGSAKLYKFADMKKATIAGYKAKKSSKK